MPSSTAQVVSSNMVPKYEVKLLMKPDVVLNSESKLESTVQEAFNVTTPATKMTVQFLDTQDRDLYNNGWSPRIRRMEGQEDVELTYKKRYKIKNGDIEAALAVANQDGFDSSTNGFKAQIDWGYENQTLSIARDESYIDSQITANTLPSEEPSREMLIEKAPGKFKNSKEDDWGTDKLKTSRIYGPIFVERYTGFWSGEEVDIEVWPIKNAAGTGMDLFIVASFKVRKYAKALEKKQELMDVLKENGWFLAQDSLMTSLIMERY